MSRFVELTHGFGRGTSLDGTSLAAPSRRFPEGDEVGRLPLAAVARIPAVVVDAGVEPRGIELDAAKDVVSGRAVLVRTGWDACWGTRRYRERGPYLASPAVDLLLACDALLVGVDFASVDDTADPARPARTRLLTAGVLVVEHLANLRALPRDGFHFFAVPLRPGGRSPWPVRAFAELLPP